MKSISRGLLLIAALTIMASCADNHIIDAPQGRCIDFRASMAKPHTRGTIVTNENIRSFAVTALDAAGDCYFADLEYAKLENSPYFSSDRKYYWPGNGSSLHFYAYAPVAELMTGVPQNTRILDFTVAQNIVEQQDLITATAIGSIANEVDGVALNFGHRLAQIELKGKNANDGYEIRVRGVRINNVVSKGTLNLAADPSWELSADNGTYSIFLDQDILLTSNTVSLMGGENALLIPQQLKPWVVTADGDKSADTTNAAKGAYVSVYVQIKTRDGAWIYPTKRDGDPAGQGYEWVAIPLDTHWQQGMKYVYTLDFTSGAGYGDPAGPHPGEPVLGDEIKFIVDVNSWEVENQNLGSK